MDEANVAIAKRLQRVCHDTLPWLISFSLGESRQEHVMRPLRYSINVTLDGCCDHRAILPDEELQELHRHAVENLDRADALLFGRVTYEMMESAWRSPAPGAMPDWTKPFPRTIDAGKKYGVSRTLEGGGCNTALGPGGVG